MKIKHQKPKKTQGINWALVLEGIYLTQQSLKPVQASEGRRR